MLSYGGIERWSGRGGGSNFWWFGLCIEGLSLSHPNELVGKAGTEGGSGGVRACEGCLSRGVNAPL